jgi:threonine synthase
MNYISTRGEAQATGFVDAVLAGLAPDGGLYVPREWPVLDDAEIAAFAGQPYDAVASEIIARFAGPAIDRGDIQTMCAEAYATFSHPAVTPLKELYPDLWMLELFHGPTLAFKDVAMQLLARLYDHVLARQGRKLTIVCATSGDTGGAAVEAFRGRQNIRIVAMFPEGRISEVQRRFMTTTADANVRAVSVEGTFDDCQNILKAMFQDDRFRQAVDLSGVNSINWARIAAQAVYYFTSAVALGGPTRPVSFAVPTGNFGDAFAGYVAQRMGLPIERIIVATNGNDILARALTGGRYERGGVVATQSPAMDIQIASNFERLYFESVEREGVETSRAFRAFSELGGIDVPPAALASMRRLFTGASVSEVDTARTMAATYNDTGQLIDPHTAVAIAAARRIGPSSPGTPLIALSTAHPAKFPEAVLEATGVAPSLPPSIADHSTRKETFDRLPADAEAIKAYVRAFAEQ